MKRGAESSNNQVAIDRGRFRRIIRFFAGAIRLFVWWDLFLARIIPNKVRQTRPARFQRIARNFREMAVEMGGVMIKAGQFLSSRVDVLPPEITQELAGLQDEVPAEPMETIRQMVIQELGRPPEDIFKSFEWKPQAAASLGQTHRARLPAKDGGYSVIVKVQRLNIENLVKTDMEALQVVARWVMLYPPIRRRVDVPALVKEFARTTWEELDYIAEADNARRFKTMFADDSGVYIPAIYSDYSTRRVLVLEDVEQIKISDGAGLKAAKINRPDVAI
ncbi:MAG: AarF/ABC1/UbiB kinase family protein, partial [Anaerolineales bacterium]|nr:AarF/ABC1/UbiB kinase family protein [Anaerolineales bacterium]